MKNTIRFFSVIALLIFVICCFTACSTLGVTTDTSDSSVLEFFVALQDNDVLPFTITEKAKVTLREQESLFLENTEHNLSNFTDFSLEYKVLTKNIDKYGDKLVYLNEAYVLDISETQLDEETMFTELHLLDLDGNSYYILSLAAYDNIFEGDYVCAYALPLGETSFENISGGTTLAIVSAGCYIEKIS